MEPGFPWFPCPRHPKQGAMDVTQRACAMEASKISEASSMSRALELWAPMAAGNRNVLNMVADGGWDVHSLDIQKHPERACQVIADGAGRDTGTSMRKKRPGARIRTVWADNSV